MPRELLTISEAAERVGVARRTVQRWLSAERFPRRKGGKVALADVRRCANEPRAGRPCGSGSLGNYLRFLDGREATGHYSESHRLAAYFIGAEGERRLLRVLRALVFEWAKRGNAEKLAELLLGFAAKLREDAESYRASQLWVMRQRERQRQQWEAADKDALERGALEARARAGDAEAIHALRERRIARECEFFGYIGGGAHYLEAVAYYREHADASGLLPRGVPDFAGFLDARHAEAKRQAQAIADAGENIRLDALAD